MIEEEFKIKNVTLKNRIVMPPMATEKSDAGAVSQKLIDHYLLRAENTGLIIIEHEYVSPDGQYSPGQLSIASDDLTDGYKKLADAIHSKNASCICQITHAGLRARFNKVNIAPSAQKIRPDDEIPREMTKEDIKRVRDDFINAALRVHKAGFDGVEIHSAHGYLLNQFYSPLTNKREDEYTGSTIEGRTRLQCEIVREIKSKVNDDFIVAIRFGACDYRQGGSKIEEIPYAVKHFADAGADLIDISGGLCDYINPESKKPGWFSELSKITKESADVPVILTGGIREAEDADKLLQEGVCDLIGVGRGMLINPNWSGDALNGR